MATYAKAFSQQVVNYAADHSRQPDRIERDLIERTEALGDRAGMQVSLDVSAALSVLVGVLAPRFAIEIGTFTGLSALTIARALPDDGRLLCCDVSEEWAAIGRESWKEAGVADRIEVRIGPALDTLVDLPADRTVDFAFVDADKPNYTAYYEALLPRLGDRGLLAVDNTLWSGRVVDAADESDTTAGIREFNDRVATDERCVASVLPVGDGLTLIRRAA